MLPKIQIATPCQESWDAMTGDDRVRHCARCDRNVYNAESLTAVEVQKLVRGTEGRLCMRLFQRQDGTLVTRDCPRPRPQLTATLGGIGPRMGSVAFPRTPLPAAPARPLTALERAMIGAFAVLAVAALRWLLS